MLAQVVIATQVEDPERCLAVNVIGVRVEQFFFGAVVHRAAQNAIDPEIPVTFAAIGQRQAGLVLIHALDLVAVRAGQGGRCAFVVHVEVPHRIGVEPQDAFVTEGQGAGQIILPLRFKATDHRVAVAIDVLADALGHRLRGDAVLNAVLE